MIIWRNIKVFMVLPWFTYIQLRTQENQLHVLFHALCTDDEGHLKTFDQGKGQAIQSCLSVDPIPYINWHLNDKIIDGWGLFHYHVSLPDGNIMHPTCIFESLHCRCHIGREVPCHVRNRPGWKALVGPNPRTGNKTHLNIHFKFIVMYRNRWGAIQPNPTESKPLSLSPSLPPFLSPWPSQQKLKRAVNYSRKISSH